MAQTINEIVSARRQTQAAQDFNSVQQRLSKYTAKNDFDSAQERLNRAVQTHAQQVIDEENQRVEAERQAFQARMNAQNIDTLRQQVASATEGYDDEQTLAERAMTNPAQLRQDIQKRVQLSNRYEDTKRSTAALESIEKYSDKQYADNFGGQFSANMALGRLSQDSALAWNTYLDHPSEANLRTARNLDGLIERFQTNNAETLADDAALPWLSQSLAGYLPQLGDQLKYSTVGGLAGGTAGTFVAPGVGTAKGVKAGIMAGSGAYTRNTMRGAAYRELINLGVDEERARALANDEAFVNGLIEMADTGVDLFTYGLGKAGVKGLTKSASPLLKFLGNYGLNVGGNTIEESLQQAVAIANRNREGTGVLNLIGETVKTVGEAAKGNEEYRAEINEAGSEGAKLAAMLFPMGAAGRAITQQALGTASKPTASPTADAQERATTDAAERVNNFAETTEGESTSVDTNPANHTAAEMNIINDYQDAVDNGVVAFIKKVKGLTNRDYRNRVKITITNVSDRLADEVKNLTGLDTRGFDHVLTGRAIDHIDKRHGANGEADHSMSDINDIARVSYVIDNYEGIELLKNEDGTVRTHSGASTADNKPAPMFRIWKRVNGTYYVVEAATDAKAQEIPIVSAYMAKANGSTDQVLNLPQDGQQLTPEALHGANTSINTNISGDGENVNTNPEGMGAASLGFDPFPNLANRYGTIPEGENPARIVDVPSQTSDTKNVSRTARTAMEAEATPDELLDPIADAISRGDFSAIRLKNDDINRAAVQTIENKGFTTAYSEWMKRVQSGRTTAEDIALGWNLYNNAANRAAEDKRNGVEPGKSTAAAEALDILEAMVHEQRNNAQKVQAQRILKSLSPTYRLYSVERTVDKINEANKGKKQEVKLSDELKTKFITAEDDAARDAALDEMIDSIARQMPPSLWEKLKAWRYVAMLGNLKTQSKNIGGNGIHAVARAFKNAHAAMLESGYARKNPGMERQRTLLFLNSKKDRDLFTEALKIYSDYASAIMEGGKYSDYLNGVSTRSNITAEIEKRRQEQVFDKGAWRILKPAQTATNKIMDKGDVIFAKPAFAGALASWLKANGFVAADITEGRMSTETMDKALSFAIKEAQEAVFRDRNAVSDFVSGLRSRKDTRPAKFANFVMDADLPFRRTPANVGVRMYEYSPASLISVADSLKQARDGKIGAADVINAIAKTATGTELLGLGVFLAAKGILHASAGDDEKEADFAAMQGTQPYSLDVGDRNITMEWISPMSVPLFIGAELWQQMSDKNGGEMTLPAVFNAIQGMFGPMEEMSMISGIADALGNIDEDNIAASLLSSAIKNYASQMIPTLFGQIERTVGEKGERRQTYIDRESPWGSGVQYTLGTLMNKTPGEFHQIPYIDQWGRRENTGDMVTTAGENFILPWYSKEIKETEVDTKLQELADKGYNVLPSEPNKAAKADGEYLKQDEFVVYAEERGQKNFGIVEELLSNYPDLTDEQRAKAIENAYDFGDYYGKNKATGYEETGWKAEYKNKSDADIADKLVYMMLENMYGTGSEFVDELEKAGVDTDTIMSAQTDNRQKVWNEQVKKTGLSAYDVLDVQYKYNVTTSDDNMSRQEKMIKFIDGKPITKEQKAALWIYLGYSEKTMPKWNN